MAIPKPRQGSYFPDWLLMRRKRAEQTLTSVLATCYLLEVSTWRMERLVESLGVTALAVGAHSVVAQYDRVLDALAENLPMVAEHLDTARADLLTFTAFPKQTQSFASSERC